MPQPGRSVLIRRAEPADAAAITRCRIDAWKETYAGKVPASFLDAMSPTDPVAIVRMADRLAPDATTRGHVAEVDGEIVGFVTAGPEREHPRASPPRGDDLGQGEIYAIYIRSPHHGRGIGARLLDEAFDFLRERGFDRVVLWVLDTNDQARRFYERQGFHETGRRQEIDLGGIVHEREYGRSLRITRDARSDARARGAGRQ